MSDIPDDTHVEVPFGPGWTVFSIRDVEARFDGDTEMTVESCYLDSPDDMATTIATVALTFTDDPRGGSQTTIGVELTAGDCHTLIEALQRILREEKKR